MLLLAMEHGTLNLSHRGTGLGGTKDAQTKSVQIHAVQPSYMRAKLSRLVAC